MAATGIGFATFIWFWPLLVVAVVGTLNPSAGDVSVFLPDRAGVPGRRGHRRPRGPGLRRATTSPRSSPARSARSLSGVPEALARRASAGASPTTQRVGFVLYAAAGRRDLPRSTSGSARARLERAADPSSGADACARARRAGRCSSWPALFSLDSAGSGFVVTSLLVLWLHLRFDLSAGTTGAVFFAAGLLGACSQLLAPRLARAVRPHPDDGVHPSAGERAAGARSVRAERRAWRSRCCSPARCSRRWTSRPGRRSSWRSCRRRAGGGVEHHERARAAWHRPRPRCWPASCSRTDFGWPLVIAGVTKVVYDVLLLVLYREVPEEVGDRADDADVGSPNLRSSRSTV